MYQAYMEIQSGVGGIDAQDWCSILMNMYLKACSKANVKTAVVSLNKSTVGLREVVILLESQDCTTINLLITETGIHRLIRISPFSTSKKRHTSFASVTVYKKSEDIVEEIPQSDLRIDTFRSSGAGGQHVNKTDSAVRIVHIPTGIKSECQSDRSQHRNKAVAMEHIHAKLARLRQEEKQLMQKDYKAQHIDRACWGTHIRSYVEDQDVVKDHRIGKCSTFKKIMSGKHLIDFIKQSTHHK